MRTATLYGSRVKLTNAHKRVNHNGKQPPYFVRMTVRRMSLYEALEKAKPMLGEVVLNTVAIEE